MSRKLTPKQKALREALLAVASDGYGGISLETLDAYLRRHEGRVVNGLRLVRNADGRYRVEQMMTH